MMQANSAIWAKPSIHFGRKTNPVAPGQLASSPLPSARPDSFIRSQKPDAPARQPQFKGYNELHAAASRGDVGKIHHLVSTKNFDYLNAQDEHGNTPLLIAARDGHLNAVRILMGRKGVDTRARNFAQQDVYEIACTRGHWKIVEFLDKKMGITCLPPIMRTGGFFFKNG